MTSSAMSYPATFESDAPAAQGRLGVFFRYLLAFPQSLVVGLIVQVAELLTVLAWFAILFTGKYPAGFGNFVAGALRWQSRVNGYLWLLTSRYPPFSLDEEPEYPVRSTFQVAVDGRNRLTVFFRPLMGIPHLVVLMFLGIAASVVLILSWLAALFTGSVPAGMHSFLTNVQRYANRFVAYMFLLTDQYPPFSLS